MSHWISLEKAICINTQIGGVMLPFDRLCIGSLEHLWHQESFIALDESENMISMGGHQVKLWNVAHLVILQTPGGEAVAAGYYRVSGYKLGAANWGRHFHQQLQESFRYIHLGLQYRRIGQIWGSTPQSTTTHTQEAVERYLYLTKRRSIFQCRFSLTSNKMVRLVTIVHP